MRVGTRPLRRLSREGSFSDTLERGRALFLHCTARLTFPTVKGGEFDKAEGGLSLETKHGVFVTLAIHLRVLKRLAVGPPEEEF